MQAQFSELLAGRVEAAAQHKHEVAGLGAGVGSPLGKGILVVEFVDAGFETAVLVDLAVHESAGANLWPLDPVGQAVELLAGVFRSAGDNDAQHGLRTVKDVEPNPLGDRRHVLELHAEADVGLVDAVLLHGLVVGHAGEVSDFAVEDRGEQVSDQAFEGVEDVFLFHEAHLAVHLGEFGLAVGAQVFVAETLDDLVVLVKTAHHQQLLEGLWALWQRVELAGIHAAGHHEVAGTFRRRLDQDGCFHIDKIDAVEVLPGLDVDPMAQQEVALDRSSAQVEVAVLHAKIIAAVGIVFNGEGRGVCRIENVQCGDFDFDFTGGDLHVLGLAFAHLSDGLDDELASQFSGLTTEVGIGVHVEGELRDTVAVTEVDEGHSAEVAGALDPAAQGDGLSDVFGAKLSAGVGSKHGDVGGP